MMYVGVYEKTPQNWSAYGPDLPDCVLAANSRDEVEQLIRDAVALQVAALREDRLPVPQSKAQAGLVEV
jgi:predicted RNase H-like HicB family nuclease